MTTKQRFSISLFTGKYLQTQSPLSEYTKRFPKSVSFIITNESNKVKTVKKLPDISRIYNNIFQSLISELTLQ